MGTVWFCLVAILIAGYVVLDGFDIGAGILHLWVPRNDAERRVVIRSIGPLWDGNEVWLLAAGGTLYFAFPALYAAGFSGFYLPLMVVLWLLILRGISLEFRNHFAGGIWPAFWDACFSLASVLLAVFYGAALGNVVRGVPFDSSGNFFEPLWTNFQPRGRTGILDWYTIFVGIVALAALALHGAAWLVLRTEAQLNARARGIASVLWWAVATLTLLLTVATFRLLPPLTFNFRTSPWGCVFPVLAIAGLLGTKWFLRTNREVAAFLCSCAYLAGMLTSVAFSIYPNVLPSSTSFLHGLTISSAKAADYGLRVGLIWWLIGMLLACGYTFFTYSNFLGKIRGEESKEGEGY